MKVSELISKGKYFPSLLAYGPLGTGKTAFFGQLGAQGEMWDFDNGFRTLEFFKDPFTLLRQETEVKTYFEPSITSPSTFLEAKEYLSETYRKLKQGKCEHKVIVLDSFTGFFKAVRAYYMSNSGAAGQLPQIQHWGGMFNEVENFLRIFMSLPCITILIAHDCAITDSAGGTKYTLLCPGKNLPTQVAGFFDDVFYCRIAKVGAGKSSYILTSKATAAVASRTRTGFTDDWPMDKGLWGFLEALGYWKPEVTK